MIVNADQINFSSEKSFIVFEGVNGAGKSTLLRRASAYLQERGKETLETFEPGDGDFGKKIRSIVLEQKEAKLQPLTELFLFAADRHEHVQTIIQPALEQKKTVLCDRYLYSTTAFQGYGRQLPLEAVEQVNNIAIQNTIPDLVILIDLDPEEGLRRTAARNEGKDSFEDEEIRFHQRLRDGFLEISKKRPEPFLLLDGMESPEKLFAELTPILDSLVS